MVFVYILIALAVILLIYGLTSYNSLVKLRNQVKEAFSTMDVYLKKRWDLIPNIVESVKGAAGYEKETLKELVELRSKTYHSMSDSDKVEANAKISGELGRIMAVAESYPALKASENFRDLSDKLAKIEEDIAMSRKYYNGSVKVYNNKAQMFPSNLIAKLFGFKEQSMFEIDDSEKENVKINLES